jgi:hypothetical protein
MTWAESLLHALQSRNNLGAPGVGALVRALVNMPCVQTLSLVRNKHTFLAFTLGSLLSPIPQTVSSNLLVWSFTAWYMSFSFARTVQDMNQIGPVGAGKLAYALEMLTNITSLELVCISNWGMAERPFHTT